MKKTIATLLASMLLLLCSFNSFGQVNVCLGDNDTLCIGTALNIQNCSGTPTGGAQGIVLSTPDAVTLSDDQWSAAVNIGFNFNFYGTNHTQLTIGSNCILSFNLANAGGYCPWSMGGLGTMPNAGVTALHNTIMPSYQDINPSTWTSPTGAIEYETIGVAPNRQFVVLYKDINFFSCTSVCNYIAIILYETSNNVEVHIGEKPLCAGWNGGLAIQGTQNPGGSVAHITPGRNNTQWSANQEGKRWTPTSPAVTTAYAISTVPYILVTSPSTSFQWENTIGQTFPYNAGTLVVNPVLPGVTGYFLSGSACGASLGSVSDTTFITGMSAQVNATGVDDICTAGIGSVTANPTQGIPPYTFNWTTLGGATTQTVNGVFAGVHTVIMTDSLGCTASANVLIGDIPAAFQGSTTVVSCPGGNDGTAFAEMIPVLGTVTYLWDDLAAQTTQTATGLPAGTYNCTITSTIGCAGVVTLDVVEIPGMVGNIVNQTDPTCNSGSDGIIEINVIQGTAPYTYSWDNSASTANTATDLVVGSHTVTVTDFNGCTITVTGVLGQPASLVINSLTPDTQICREDDITLTATGVGGSSPYIFTWYENSIEIGTGTSITVNPSVTNTQYCVILSEECGSPTDEECTLIYFPTDIIPSLVPDELEKCLPGYFEFENTSANGAEIATTYYDFGDHHGAALEVNIDSTSYTYNQVGVFDVAMTITSIYGCVYTDTLEQLIEVMPNPTADFTFSVNPSDIYETDINLQDRSSSDVISWNWYSPFSNPSSSILTNPGFDFPQVIGVYPITLIVETINGCIDTVTLNMNIRQDLLVFAPNSFTPNDDEHNQVWKAEFQGIDLYSFELFIFNRWGEIIWESNDSSIGWDGTYNGKYVKTGVYTWKANVKDLYTDEKKTFNGSINLLK